MRPNPKWKQSSENSWILPLFLLSTVNLTKSLTTIYWVKHLISIQKIYIMWMYQICSWNGQNIENKRKIACVYRAQPFGNPQLSRMFLKLVMEDSELCNKTTSITMRKIGVFTAPLNSDWHRVVEHVVFHEKLSIRMLVEIPFKSHRKSFEKPLWHHKMWLNIEQINKRRRIKIFDESFYYSAVHSSWKNKWVQCS